MFSSGSLNDPGGWLSYATGEVLFFIRRYWIALTGVLVGLIIAFFVILLSDFRKVQELADYQPSVTTRIYDQNNVLIAELFKQKREVVPFEKVPKDLVHAFIAMEDNEFYDHWGINPKGIVRAFFINVFSGSIRQGGSTITQQTAKILLTSRKRTIYRKIKEAFISLMMEVTYTKDEILAMYFNQLFMGHGAYGVESASKLYFDKHVWELNMAECALLATLPSAPNRLSPIKYPKRSMARHRIALARMVELGFTTVEEAEKSYLDFWPDYLNRIQEMPPSMSTWSLRVDRAPWFTEYIRRRLVKEYGEEMVYEKGLHVYTTLDIRKQEAAQRVMEKRLDQQTKISSRLAFTNEDYFQDHFNDRVALMGLLFDMPSFTRRGSRQVEKVNDYLREAVVQEFSALNYIAGLDNVGEVLEEFSQSYVDDRELQHVEGALISLNTKNGYIEAMVGGSEFSPINQLNRTVQMKRQPGSSIKPLLYAAAFETKAFTAASTILDSPIVYLDHEGGDWLPENYEGSYHGLVRLRKALAYSINVVSIRIADEIGIETVLRYYAKILRMSDAEAKERIPRNFSIALGSLEVSPLEMARAYAILSNGGRDVIPTSIRYINDRDGKLVKNYEKEIQDSLKERAQKGTLQVIRPETSQLMISMLRNVVAAGTGQGANPGAPAGGKTGTTNNWKDAWFIGFTPSLSTALWIGYDRMGLSLGTGQAGGVIAAPAWGEYMRQVVRVDGGGGFPTYGKLESAKVCAHTGLKPSKDCDVVEELFIPGTVPEEECDLCEGRAKLGDIPDKGPKEDLTRGRTREVLDSIRNNKDDDILDQLGDDLLKDGF